MTLTVLRACSYNDQDADGNYFRVEESGLVLTKTILNDGTKLKSSFPKIFSLGDFHDPKTLDELLPVLKFLGDDPKALVIRHKFVNKAIGTKVRRQAKNVTDSTSHIIALDIDELPLPEGMDRTNIKEQGEYVCSLLNKCDPLLFPESMGFIAQGSSSSGFSDTIKLHMWLRNKDLLSQGQLRNLFYHTNVSFKRIGITKTNIVDPALYHNVQAHYTAYPIFEDPEMDPYINGGRTVLRDGKDSEVPNSYSEYVKPVITTNEERVLMASSIEGGLVKSSQLQARIDRLRAWEPSDPGFRTAVISVMHSAIQEQFCLAQLECELKPVIESIRPGSSKEYIAQGIISAQNNIKACSIRDLPHECKGLEIKTLSGGTDTKFLHIQDELPDNSVTFLKATLGTGKTFTIESWLRDGKIPGKFLALTDTAALVESNAARFNAGDFRDVKERMDFQKGNISRLSGTLHSLIKIKDLNFDFLFIDEADSLMNNLLFASIIKEEDKAQIAEVLSDLLINTNRVVISDGDISEETVQAYVDLMRGERNLYRIEHSRRNLENVVAIKHTKESSLWGALKACLSVGDKCLLVSDYSPSTLNEYYTALRRVLPDKRVHVVHSSSKMDGDVGDIINNTTKALKRRKVDALLCSPSVTNGVDFNYFDTVFVLTTTENHTPNMRYQAMMRERDPKEIHFYFNNMKSYSTGYRGLTIDKGWAAQARQMYAIRREKEYKTYVATFIHYLVQAGATVRVEDEHYTSPLDKEDKEVAKVERIAAILGASEHNTPQRHNDAHEMLQLLKIYYDIDGDPTWDDCEDFVVNKPHVRAAYLHKVFKGFWHVLQHCNPELLSDFLKTKEGFKFHLASGESIAGGVFKAKSILARCGLNHGPAKALEWYKKYCENTVGVEMPEELKDTLELVADL